MQPKFSFSAPLGAAALFAAVLAADSLFESLPDRQAATAAVTVVTLEPIAISAAELAPLALVGAWRLTSSEPRVGGISGLAVNDDELVAITDAGVVLRFPKSLGRQMQAQVTDLPSGPGDERCKANRDSEAILRDDRGWWIAFENADELWLFDARFKRTLRRLIVPGGLGLNTGIEGLAASPRGILAFPESGGSTLLWGGGRWDQLRLDRRTPISDAVQVDGGAVLLIERRLTPTGFRNALALLRVDGAVLRTVWRKRLPVGWRDNVEAVAAEPIAAGGYRLWMMSDDNFHPRLRTILLVVDVPGAVLPKRP